MNKKKKILKEKEGEKMKMWIKRKREDFKRERRWKEGRCEWKEKDFKKKKAKRKKTYIKRKAEDFIKKESKAKEDMKKKKKRF